MKKFFPTISFVAMSFIAASAHPGYPKMYTQEEKIYALGVCWSELKFNFVGIEDITFDLDSLYRATLDRVIKTKNDVEFYRELDRFFGVFHDGHTDIVLKHYDESLYYDDIPASIMALDRRFYFTSIKKTELDSLLLGAEILEIDGIPVKQYVENNYIPYVCRSTDNARWIYAANMMQTRMEGQRKFKGKARLYGSDRIVRYHIPFNWRMTISDKDEYWSIIPDYRNMPVHTPTLHWPTDDIAVLSLGYFDEDTPQKIHALMPEICDRAKGLIIDLRYGRGGHGDVGWYLRMCIDSADSLLIAGSRVRVNNSYYRSQGNYVKEYESYFLNETYEEMPSEWIERNDSVPCVHCPVAVLIGSGTASACEDFLIDLYEAPHRPAFIGEETVGSTGAPYVVELPHGGCARICSRQVLFPYSRTPFKQGIKPDMEVKFTIDDLMKGRDPVIEKAVAFLQTRKNETAYLTSDDR